MESTSRRERSWILYDVGNSAFVLVMVTAIMPIFFKEYAARGMAALTSTAYWGFANSLASLILALLAPLLGAMADYRRKKTLFVIFCALGLLFTFVLPIVQAGQWLLCLALFVAARVGWAGANIFYDAFLPDVAEPARMDLVSARGYAWGYIGSVVPFLAIIAILLSAGMAEGLPIAATKIGFLIVGCWWLVFTLPMLRNVRQRFGRTPSGAVVVEAFTRIFATLSRVRKYRRVFLFLAAYFFYIDGVGTVISMSAAYGRDLGFTTTLLILVLLCTQVVAFPFALLFGRLAEKFSTRSMLLAGIAVYCCTTFIAFLLPSVGNPALETALFWVVAFLIASCMGGIQALSRSYYARLIPPESSAEFFGFYNVFGKFATIVGPALMGGIGRLTGETRWGVLSILVLFVIGGVLLLQVKEQSV